MALVVAAKARKAAESFIVAVGGFLGFGSSKVVKKKKKDEASYKDSLLDQVVHD